MQITVLELLWFRENVAMLTGILGTVYWKIRNDMCREALPILSVLMIRNCNGDRAMADQICVYIRKVSPKDKLTSSTFTTINRNYLLDNSTSERISTQQTNQTQPPPKCSTKSAANLETQVPAPQQMPQKLREGHRMTATHNFFKCPNNSNSNR